MRAGVLAGILLMFALAGFGCANDGARMPATGQPSDLVVLAGTLIDGTGAPPLRDAAIVVRNGVIESVESRDRTTLPPGARVIDARDRWVMPGLADMHVHFGTGGLGPTDAGSVGRILRQFVFYGVTTVLNLGATHGTPESLGALRARIAAGTLVGPTTNCRPPSMPEWTASCTSSVIRRPRATRC
jgi:hypothetical protein